MLEKVCWPFQFEKLVPRCLGPSFDEYCGSQALSALQVYELFSLILFVLINYNKILQDIGWMSSKKINEQTWFPYSINSQLNLINSRHHWSRHETMRKRIPGNCGKRSDTKSDSSTYLGSSKKAEQKGNLISANGQKSLYWGWSSHL